MGILENVLSNDDSGGGSGGLQTLWAYQDFPAGAITTTSATLTANQNGVSAAFNTASFYNYASIVRSDNGDYVYTSGFVSMFQSLVEVTAQSGASITLNKVPNPSTPCRIWWLYKGYMPNGYIIPPPSVLDSAALINLENIFQSLDEKDQNNGYVGLTNFKINFKNSDGSQLSSLTNTNTAPRNYVFQDRDGIIADDINLALKADKSTTISTSNGITGGGDLSGNRTISGVNASTSVVGVVQLSNSYTGTSQTKAVTEKALSDALLTTAPKLQGEPVGFDGTSYGSPSLTWNEATRTITVGGNFSFFSDGNKITKVSTSPSNKQISDQEGDHFIYFDGYGNLTEMVSFSEELITRYTYVAYIYWDATNKKAIPDLQIETHEASWPSTLHLEQHLTVGTRYQSGLALTLTPDGTGNADNNIQFTGQTGVIWDEDLDHYMNTKNILSSFPKLYRSGASGYWRMDTSTNYLVLNTGTGRAAYNQYISGSWQLTEIANNAFGLAYVYVCPSLNTNRQWFVVIGQNSYNSVSEARDAAVTAPNLGNLPLQEFKLVGAVIIQTSDTYTNTAKSRVRTIDGTSPYVDWRRTESSSNNAIVANSDIAYLQSQIDNKQPLDTALTNLSNLNSTYGILVNDANDSFIKRSIVGTANQVNVANSDGIAGNPQISLPQNLDLTTNLITNSVSTKTAIDSFTANGQTITLSQTGALIRYAQCSLGTGVIYYRLPDATTMNLNSTFILNSETSYNILLYLKDYTGAAIGVDFILTNQRFKVVLTNNSTAAGTWKITREIVDYGPIKYDKTFDNFIVSNLEVDGDIDFTLGGRLKGNFTSNAGGTATYVMSHNASDSTDFGIIPSSGGIGSKVTVYNSNDTTNSSKLQIRAALSGESENTIESSSSGAGSTLPMSFKIAGSEKLRLSADGIASQLPLGGYPFSALRNKVINGDMRFDSRRNNAGVIITAINGPTPILDRWVIYSTAASKFQCQKNAGAARISMGGFPDFLAITSLSAYTILSTDMNILQHVLTGYATSDLLWGTVNAKPVTLTFSVRSSRTGTFGGAIAAGDYNRTYPFTYTINSANTTEVKTITIPGDTAGTWYTDETNSMRIIFGIGVGSASKGPANSWASMNYKSATGTSDLITVNGAYLDITGVQLEVGKIYSGFDVRPPALELTMCNFNAPIFNAYASSATALAAGAVQKVNFQVTYYTFGGGYDTATSRFTPTVAGFYRISTFITLSIATGLNVWIFKNGLYDKAICRSYGVAASGWGGSAEVLFNGTTDYVEIYVQAPINVNTYTGAQYDTWFQGSFIRGVQQI